MIRRDLEMTQTNRPEYGVSPLLNSPPLATLVVALLYAVVAQVGYLTTILPGHVSPIFPSAGVALAAVLILGRPAFLGVLLGSFLANGISYILGLPSHLSSQVRIHGGPTIVFVIGFGAMASAGAGAFLVRKFCQDQYPLGSARNLRVLVAVGGLSCYTISATFGVLGLALAGITPWKLFGNSWLTWWIGDVAGVIIVAPLILSWLHAMTWWKGLRRAGEAAALGGVLLSLSWYVFFRSAPLEYGLLPVLLVAAFRFDMRGATAAAAIVAVLATIGTSHGTGPFSQGSVNESLLLLHSFLSVNVICALFLAAVLSERKAAEDSLRESEEKFAAAFRNSPDAVYVTDGETAQFLEVNESFENLSGWTRAETIGRTAQDLGFWVNPLDQERYFGTRSKEGRLRNLDVSCRFRDGSLHSLEVSSQPLEFGRRRCFLTIARDITERKQAEQEMERLQLELMQAQKMESIGRLAGGVAHDFNNLLTVINGYSRMLVDTLNTDDPRRQSVEGIYSAGQRAAGITKQLLAFSRKQVLELRVLDLNHLLKDMESMLRRLVSEDVEVRFALSAEGPTVRADPHQLKQVVMNLAVNAWTRCPTEGV
jgi:PAS domain S-box-containing protein